MVKPFPNNHALSIFLPSFQPSFQIQCAERRTCSTSLSGCGTGTRCVTSTLRIKIRMQAHNQYTCSILGPTDRFSPLAFPFGCSGPRAGFKVSIPLSSHCTKTFQVKSTKYPTPRWRFHSSLTWMRYFQSYTVFTSVIQDTGKGSFVMSVFWLIF